MKNLYQKLLILLAIVLFSSPLMLACGKDGGLGFYLEDFSGNGFSFQPQGPGGSGNPGGNPGDGSGDDDNGGGPNSFLFSAPGEVSHQIHPNSEVEILWLSNPDWDMENLAGYRINLIGPDPDDPNTIIDTNWELGPDVFFFMIPMEFLLFGHPYTVTVNVIAPDGTLSDPSDPISFVLLPTVDPDPCDEQILGGESLQTDQFIYHDLNCEPIEYTGGTLRL